MSRSYRKPCIKEYKSCKLGKRDANKWLRRTQKNEFSIINGNMYKKFYNSWYITDYKYVIWKSFKHYGNKGYWTKEEYNKWVIKISRK